MASVASTERSDRAGTGADQEAGLGGVGLHLGRQGGDGGGGGTDDLGECERAGGACGRGRESGDAAGIGDPDIAAAIDGDGVGGGHGVAVGGAVLIREAAGFIGELDKDRTVA